MTTERHRVPVSGGALALVLHLPPRPRSACVVACHGLGASKDSDEEETTIASRIEDAQAALAFLAAHPRPPCRLVLVPGGDHRLSDPAPRRHAVAASRQWRGRFL